MLVVSVAYLCIAREQEGGRWSKYKSSYQVSYIKKGSSKLDRADDALVGCLHVLPTLGNILVRWDLLKGPPTLCGLL